MKRKNAASLLALIAGLACTGMRFGPPTLAQKSDPLVMIANKGNAAASGMTKIAARKLLLGDILKWPNGAKVAVVLRPVGSSERTTVLSAVCGMSEAEYTRHNLQAMFMGETVASVQQEPSSATVRGFVKANPGAVGFVHKSEVDDNVKVVWTME
jgi:ABC-type phosphate transport system substrate-binding protein